MNQGKNNKRFLTCLMIGMAIVNLICLCVLTFNTYGLANITLNPYCTGDTDRIEELTENFIGKYSEEDVSIDWNENMNIPDRIRIYRTEPFIIRYPEIPSSWEANPTVVELWANSYKSEYIEKAKEFAFSFLSGNSQFLGIDMNELEYSKTDVGSRNTYAKVMYNQVYKGVPVDDGDLYIIVDSEENPRGQFRMIMNSSDYYPCIDVDVVPNISMEEAESVVLEDRGVTELFNVVKIPVGNNSIFYEYVSQLNNTTSGEVEIPTITKLVIYPKGDNVYLCWKFLFNLGDMMHYWYYYIDAHTGDIIYKYQSFPISGSPSGETESDNSESNNPSQNQSISNSYPIGLIISPLYQTIPWISSPVNYHYGLSYSSPSLTLPWEQTPAYTWARGASVRNIYRLNTQLNFIPNYSWQTPWSVSQPYYYGRPWPWSQAIDQILSGIGSLPPYGWNTASDIDFPIM